MQEVVVRTQLDILPCLSVAECLDELSDEFADNASHNVQLREVRDLNDPPVWRPVMRARVTTFVTFLAAFRSMPSTWKSKKCCHSFNLNKSHCCNATCYMLQLDSLPLPSHFHCERRGVYLSPALAVF